MLRQAKYLIIRRPFIVLFRDCVISDLITEDKSTKEREKFVKYVVVESTLQ